MERENEEKSKGKKEKNIICDNNIEENKGDKKNEIYYEQLMEINKSKTNKIFKRNKSKKKYIIKSNKAKNEKKFEILDLNDTTQNSSNRQYIKFTKYNSSKSLIKDIIKKKTGINENLMKTDYDLDNLNFNNAKFYDKRTFWQYYISLIRTKHIIFFVFKPKYKFHSKIIRYCFLLFLFPLYLFKT